MRRRPQTSGLAAITHTGAVVVLTLASGSCSESTSSRGAGDAGQRDETRDVADAAPATTDGGGGFSFDFEDAWTGRTDDAEPPTGCATSSSAEADLSKVRLAVAFDVSGSMGELDLPHHDPVLKWDPVVRATKAFFTDPASAGISASITFFPLPGEEDYDVKCDAANYVAPHLEMTPLPSTSFGDAIDEATPQTQDEWGDGTPTEAVLGGQIVYLQSLPTTDPPTRDALVLISDGHPQGCHEDADDPLEQAMQETEAAIAAVADTIPTYVIGVANPPSGPDNVTNLHRLAMAGNTDSAFIIETGDPEQTQRDFRAAITEIREAAVSCEFEIPPPPAGQEFDPDRANVTYLSDGSENELAYDAECKSDAAWRYDDPDRPTHMELCPEACARVQADPLATLSVEYGCKRRDVVQ